MSDWNSQEIKENNTVSGRVFSLTMSDWNINDGDIIFCSELWVFSLTMSDWNKISILGVLQGQGVFSLTMSDWNSYRICILTYNLLFLA